MLNMTFQNGASISLGTQDVCGFPSQCHDILIRNNYLTNTGQIGNISGFNGINNVVIEYTNTGGNLIHARHLPRSLARCTELKSLSAAT